ncbi:MAG: nucleoside triphosphate pyrophosphatase, partial [Candidatus Scalindua sp.]
ASASPRRKEILEKTGLKFKVDASDYEEEINYSLRPHELARFLSREKAKAIVNKYTNALIIAADTFIVFKGKILGKPYTEEEAKRMLKMLNNRTHSVITGFTIIDTDDNKKLSGSVETKVYFKKLTIKEIESYIKSKEPLDKAGAYAIQGLGAVIVKRIEGDYFNVMGLPLSTLMETLKKFGIYVL